MLPGVDVPGYDNCLDMLTEASFCARSECELLQLSSFFMCSKQSQLKRLDSLVYGMFTSGLVLYAKLSSE